MDLYSLLSPAISLIGGMGLKVAYDIAATRLRYRKELADNNRIDVSGEDWQAAWQTSVDSVQVLNTERLSMDQRGATVKIWNRERSPENPKGGYLWQAQMHFFHGRTLMGWYFPLPAEQNTSKGILYLTYLSPRRVFYGKWVGSSYDGDLATGFVVISKDRSNSLAELNRCVAVHGARVNVLSTVIEGTPDGAA